MPRPDEPGAEVIELDAHRPHVTLLVRGRKPAVHVIPVAAIRAWIDGRAPLPGRPVLRAVLAEWLRLLEAEHELDDTIA